MTFLQQFVNSYLATAKWASDYDVYEFSEEAKKKAEEDCKIFIGKVHAHFPGNYNDILNRNNTDLLAPHDFFLTRNHHGAGFWDGDWIELDPEDQLTKISQSFKEVDVYIGDDELLYFQ